VRLSTLTGRNNLAPLHNWIPGNIKGCLGSSTALRATFRSLWSCLHEIQGVITPNKATMARKAPPHVPTMDAISVPATAYLPSSDLERTKSSLLRRNRAAESRERRGKTDLNHAFVVDIGG
jgi:hypothetical protein